MGGYLSLRTIAACYRVLDLWYTIRTAYARVIGGILVWGGAAGLIGALLRGHHRQMYLWGLAGYPVFYLSLYVLRHLLLRDRGMRSQSA